MLIASGGLSLSLSFPSLQLSPRSFLAGREGKTLSSFVMTNTIAVTPALPLFFADRIVD